MNPKILMAFAGGLILASGVTYIAMRNDALPAAQTAKVNTPPAVQPVQPEVPPPADETPAPDLKEMQPARKPAPAVAREQTAPRRPRPAPVTAPPVSTPASTASTPAPAPPVTTAPQQQAENATDVAKNEPAPLRLPDLPPPPPEPHKVTVPSGTLLTVRLGETLSTEKNQPGDQFSAVLDQPLVVDGFVIAERGAKARGRIVELDRSGKVKGLARMAVELTQIHTSDGQNIKVNTAAFNRQAQSTRRKDATKVGVGAAIGAAIGAIAGGGKGAAIGAGVGGAAGAGDVLLTRGGAAELPVETRVSFRLSEPVTITEKLH